MSSSTPPTCCPAQFHRRSMGRAPPFTGRVSIGVDRSNTRLLACASPKITFRTVQVRARAPAGTRRGIYGCNWPHGVRAGFSFVRACSASATDGSVRPFGRAISPWQFLILLCCAIESSTSSEGRIFRSARDVCACVVIRTAVGILATHTTMTPLRIGSASSSPERSNPGRYLRHLWR